MANLDTLLAALGLENPLASDALKRLDIRDRDLLTAILVATSSGGSEGDPATEAKQDTANSSLSAIAANTQVGAGTRVSSTAYEASRVLKASAGTLVELIGYNSGPDQFIQIHNSATVPLDTAVPIRTFKVLAASNFSLSLSSDEPPMSAGIVVCNSTTGPTKTIGADNCFFTAVLK
jgi:hypothetical protein